MGDFRRVGMRVCGCSSVACLDYCRRYRRRCRLFFVAKLPAKWRCSLTLPSSDAPVGAVESIFCLAVPRYARKANPVTFWSNFD